MKSVNKIIAVSVMSMGLVSGLYCEKRKLVVTTKNTGMYDWAAVEVWQGGSVRESAAKFTKSTAGKNTIYSPSQPGYLFFDPSKGNVEIRFYWTASSMSGVGGGLDVPPFKMIYSVDQLTAIASARKDKTPTITIDCPRPRDRASSTDVGRCKVSPMPSESRPAAQTQQAPAAVTSEAPIKYTKVKVVKTDSSTHGFKWTVQSLHKKVDLERVKNQTNFPPKSQIYSTVNILKDTSLVSKLKVPNNRDFWILVSSNNKEDKKLMNPVISEKIPAGAIESGSVINIDGKGNVTVK